MFKHVYKIIGKKTGKPKCDKMCSAMNPQKRKSFVELQEEFTFAGFLAVSGWAFIFFMQSVFLLVSFLKEFFEVKWYYYLLFYLALWIICFLFFCLIPKIKGEK